ncbi:hypothetical protein [Kitasatospora sp. NBC_01300]|uniref:hypothetical protein n=1 Tax=Kitasatospora sp. NBC_01300 TaxID=2903574 RepID=UPI00352E940A|nr:hypothetical protein OG556_30430 [Kitasatospora sp. NBC_01300]
MSRNELSRRILHEAFPEVDSSDPVSYFSETGDAVQALMYSWLYWPNLVEIHGAVFLALYGNDEVEIANRLATPSADGHPDWPAMAWGQMVDSYNIFEIPHLFRMMRGPSELAADACRQLGDALVQTWQGRLLATYPERRFTVRMIEGDDSMDLRIEVSQLTPSLVPPKGWDGQRRGITVTS